MSNKDPILRKGLKKYFEHGTLSRKGLKKRVLDFVKSLNRNPTYFR
jgi:hypothetical protein